MRSSTRFPCLALVIAVSACGHDDNVRAPRELACAPDQVTMSNLRGYDLQLAEGCGKRDVYHWDQSADKWVSLRTRAAFDLGCEREKIQVKVLDAVTYGTTGCDRRATFKYIVLTGFVMNASDESPKGRERQ